MFANLLGQADSGTWRRASSHRAAPQIARD